MSKVTTRITKRSHPTVFAAFLAIDYDNGAVNRLEPERKYYDIPEPWIAELDTAEKALSSLSKEELNTFCCDEESVRMAIGKNIPPVVNAMLNAYFEDWL